jgi:hypothetical protein
VQAVGFVIGNQQLERSYEHLSQTINLAVLIFPLPLKELALTKVICRTVQYIPQITYVVVTIVGLM